ncbi:hypothetical protein [Abyssogena phaseoliformis symbiont]|uniref:hypothetical protein n=1 Tax=Abyssogena phaseoliformis symbiont TaxID=596095 RepID=UPI0019169C18|nr:hypothetical protein [Abyssogena phaseoliformis symbiont]MBW5289749.1 hypothetical protein [Candidatus Ruthia sp. Apha_13_S6]
MQQSEAQNELFYFLLLMALGGSFVNMQFSFPYQMAMPPLLFGLYVGLIAKQSKCFIEPRKILCIKPIKNILMSLSVMSFLIVYSIYIDWIRFYNELNTRHYKNV